MKGGNIDYTKTAKIILDDFRGTVKKIGIRTTTIEDAGGNLKIVNNSDIRNIQNRGISPYRSRATPSRRLSR